MSHKSESNVQLSIYDQGLINAMYAIFQQTQFLPSTVNTCFIRRPLGSYLVCRENELRPIIILKADFD
jgi:hypothetical protein